MPIYQYQCQKCGKCVSVCRQNAIFQAPGQYPQIFPELCSACGACWITCPHNAIKTEKREIGRIYQNKISDNFYLVTGEANALLEETGPVVAEVREFAQKFDSQIEIKIPYSKKIAKAYSKGNLNLSLEEIYQK